jgi:hypothetical protein
VAFAAFGWRGLAPSGCPLFVTLNALVHNLSLLEFPLGLEFLDAPGSLWKQRMANTAITYNVLVQMVRKGHASELSTLNHHIFRAFVLTSSCRTQEKKEALEQEDDYFSLHGVSSP